MRTLIFFFFPAFNAGNAISLVGVKAFFSTVWLSISDPAGSFSPSLNVLLSKPLGTFMSPNALENIEIPVAPPRTFGTTALLTRSAIWELLIMSPLYIISPLSFHFSKSGCFSIKLNKASPFLLNFWGRVVRISSFGYSRESAALIEILPSVLAGGTPFCSGVVWYEERSLNDCPPFC